MLDSKPTLPTSQLQQVNCALALLARQHLTIAASAKSGEEVGCAHIGLRSPVPVHTKPVHTSIQSTTTPCVPLPVSRAEGQTLPCVLAEKRLRMLQYGFRMGLYINRKCV